MSAAPVQVLYTLPDAGITHSWFGPDYQETLIRIMEFTQAGGAEDRIAALEIRLRDMDALVGGLMAELLDMKAVSLAMTRQNDERSRQDPVRGPAVQRSTIQESAGSSVSPADATSPSGSTIIRLRNAGQPGALAAPAEPQMVRIMQTDGTMKMEARHGDDRIDSSVGYGKNKRGSATMSKQNPLIYAADEDKTGAKK
jgi:hypothetical protein